MKQPEKPAPEKKEEHILTYRDLTRRMIDSFRARPDDPKYTYEEQTKVAEVSWAADKKLVEEKTKELNHLVEEADKQFRTTGRFPNEALYKKSVEEKTKELSRLRQEAEERFLESKSDKKHITSVMVPLQTFKFFLESKEANTISEIEKGELKNKTNELLEELGVARQKQDIPDQLIEKVLSFLDEAEIYLNQ